MDNYYIIFRQIKMWIRVIWYALPPTQPLRNMVQAGYFQITLANSKYIRKPQYLWMILYYYRVIIINFKNKLLFLGLIRLWRTLVCRIISLILGHLSLFKSFLFLNKIHFWKSWKNWKYFENLLTIRLIGRCSKWCLWRCVINAAKRGVWKITGVVFASLKIQII